MELKLEMIWRRWSFRMRKSTISSRITSSIYTKYFLERVDKTTNYHIYAPFPKPDVRENVTFPMTCPIAGQVMVAVFIR